MLQSKINFTWKVTSILHGNAFLCHICYQQKCLYLQLTSWTSASISESSSLCDWCIFISTICFSFCSTIIAFSRIFLAIGRKWSAIIVGWELLMIGCTRAVTMQSVLSETGNRIPLIRETTTFKGISKFAETWPDLNGFQSLLRYNQI